MTAYLHFNKHVKVLIAFAVPVKSVGEYSGRGGGGGLERSRVGCCREGVRKEWNLLL